MDRISDSGSDDWGSTPHGRTKSRTAIMAVRLFLCRGKEHRVQARSAVLAHRVTAKCRRSATITSFHKTFSNKFECFSLTLHYLCNVKRIFVYIMCFVMAFGVAAKKKQTIEPGYSWQVSGPLGLRTPSTIDTLYQGYHRQFVPAMTTDAYATTGNFGCAGVDEIFFNREEWSEFQFEDVLSHWLHNADNQRYYNTRVPMTLLGYSWGGGRNSGQDRLKGEFSGNVNKRLQFGAQLDYLYSKGGYDRQALKNFGWGFSSSYIGDRYDMHAMFFSYNSLNHENGGITDDLYISDPAQLQGGDSKIDAKAIPVNLSSAFSRVKGWEVYMNHRYKVGYWQEETVNDTTKRRTYVPVSSFIWTMDYKTNTHKFKNQSAADDAKYFANNYL